MRKSLKFIVAAIIALIFIGTFIFLWIKSQPQAVVYEEFIPAVRNLHKTTTITGRIEPRNIVNVKPQISGIVTEILKEAGENVQAGEVIARLKVIPDMAQLSAAESRVRLAVINMKQAQVDYQRMKELYDKGLIAAEEYDKTFQVYKQAKEENNAANEHLQVIRDGASKNNANASTTLVRSTISGTILDIPVKIGNSVILSNTFNDGTTIATVANMNDLIFKGNIDETEVGQIKQGMPMKITIGALRNVVFDATLEYISPQAVDNNGANQFEIKAAIKNKQGHHIRSGYSANSEIVLAQATQTLTIPESAIEFDNNKTFVYVVKGDENNKTYERQQITTGLSDGIYIEVKSGLKAQDKVRGPQKIDNQETK